MPIKVTPSSSRFSFSTSRILKGIKSRTVILHLQRTFLKVSDRLGGIPCCKKMHSIPWLAWFTCVSEPAVVESNSLVVSDDTIDEIYPHVTAMSRSEVTMGCSICSLTDELSYSLFFDTPISDFIDALVDLLIAMS